MNTKGIEQVKEMNWEAYEAETLFWGFYITVIKWDHEVWSEFYVEKILWKLKIWHVYKQNPNELTCSGIDSQFKWNKPNKQMVQ